VHLAAAELTGTAVPVASALVAGLFAARLLGRFAQRPAGHLLCWGLGMLLFAAASAAEAYGASDGWGETTFSIYYLCGGVLTVALLGLGSAWLHLPRALALVAVGVVLAAVPAAAIAVLAADVDPVKLAGAGVEPPPNDALDGLAYLWAIALNSLGTLGLIAGSLRSILSGRLRRANALIIAGVALVALSGTFTRTGSHELVYVVQLCGVAVMYLGFELSMREGAGLSSPRAGRSSAW
jgi:hypothetical protein